VLGLGNGFGVQVVVDDKEPQLCYSASAQSSVKKCEYHCHDHSSIHMILRRQCYRNILTRQCCGIPPCIHCPGLAMEPFRRQRVLEALKTNSQTNNHFDFIPPLASECSREGGGRKRPYWTFSLAKTPNSFCFSTFQVVTALSLMV